MRATVGMSTGSAYGARNRIAMCSTKKTAASITTGTQKSGGEPAGHVGLDHAGVHEDQGHPEDQQAELDVAAGAGTGRQPGARVGGRGTERRGRSQQIL